MSLDAMTASKISTLRRRYRNSTQLDAEQAILGDENGAVSVPGQREYYFVRFANGENSDGTTQYGRAFPVLSGAGYMGSEQVGTAVYIGMAVDGQLAILQTDRSAMIEGGVSPRGENPNSPYSKFKYMRDADLFLAQPLGTQATPVLEVRVEPTVYIDADGVLQVFAGAVIDLSGDVPAADGDGNAQHLISGVFVSTANALESFTSTAKLTSVGLTWTTDVAAVLAARSARALPARYYVLYTAQTLLSKSDEFNGGDGREWITAPKRKNNYAATAAPTVNDDIDDGVGYEVGSHWIDTTTDNVYVCVDSTSGAAIWAQLSTSNITRTTAATYNVVATDTTIFANTDSNAVTVNLQAGAANRQMRICNTGISNTAATIAPNGAEKLIGLNNSFVLLDGEAMIIQYDTTDGWC